MRILLDACVPRLLANQLSKHDVRTVPDMGWADMDDGPLLDVEDIIADFPVRPAYIFHIFNLFSAGVGL